MKKIEIGISDTGFYVFPKDFVLKSGLDRQKCVDEIRKWHKRRPAAPVVIISGMMPPDRIIIQSVIDEALNMKEA